MSKARNNNGLFRRLPVAELLEPRVLYSADALGMLAPLLMVDEQAEHITEPLYQSGKDRLIDAASDGDPIKLPDENPNSSINHIVFIDETVPDSDQLLAAINTETTRVVYVGAQDNGLLAITKAMSEHRNLDSVQIYSHGSAGELHLGDSLINEHSLLVNQSAIKNWSTSLTQGADILLWGCDVAAGDVGRSFVEQLSNFTGADVAASTDLTGHTEQLADWKLEFRSGVIDESLLLTATEMDTWNHALLNYYVNTTVDTMHVGDTTSLANYIVHYLSGGAVSLRDALFMANKNSSVDTIHLPAGIFELTGDDADDDVSKKGDLDVLQNVIISGAGAGDGVAPDTTLIRRTSGTDDGRLIEVITGGLTLEGVQLSGGVHDEIGGGIYSRLGTSLILNATVVTGNNSTEDGGGIYAEGTLILQNQSSVADNVSDNHGGGLYAKETVEINDSSVLNNQSRQHGGGIYANDVVLQTADVSNNVSTNQKGGGIYAEKTITGSQFSITGNTAKHEGGGYHAQESTVLSNGTVSDNTSEDRHGGGGYHEKNALLYAVTFYRNDAGTEGGGLYAKESIDLHSSYFEGNVSAGDGGAAYAEKDFSAIQSGFSQNLSLTDGGALRLTGDSTISQSSFFVNDVPGGKGSAIYHTASGSLTIINATFAQNLAEQGGTVYSDMAVNITASSFIDNWTNTGSTVLEANRNNVYTLASSLFFGNTNASSPGNNFSHSIISDGFNWLDFTDSGLIATDLIGTDPLLGTETQVGFVSAFPLLSGSSAINAGMQGTGAADSQGFSRDAFPDIGASEYTASSSVVVWSDSAGNIYRSDPQFSNTQLLLSGLNNPDSIAIDSVNSRIYWLQNGGTQLLSTDFNGQAGGSVLTSGLTDATSIAIDAAAGRVYIAFEGGTPRIDRYSISAGTFQQSVLTAGIAKPTDLAFNSATGRIFWSEKGLGSVTAGVRSALVDGTNMVTHPTGTQPEAITVNTEGTEIYLTDRNSDELIRYVISTSTSTRFTTAPNTDPQAAAFDSLNQLLVWESDATNALSSISHDLSAEQNSMASPAPINDIAVVNASLPTAIPILGLNVPLSVLEGSTTTLLNTHLSASDSDSANSEINYTLVNGPSNGSISVGTATNQTTFTQAQIDAGDVLYVHNGGESAADAFDFRIDDSEHYSQVETFDLLVSPENDTPILTTPTSPITIGEAGARVLTTADLSVTDPDGIPSGYVYQIMAPIVNGTVSVNSSVISNGNTFTHAEFLAGDVVFTQVGAGLSTASLSVNVSDDVGATSATSVLDFNVPAEGVAANNIPVLSTPALPTEIIEGLSYVLTTSELIVTDADGIPSGYVYKVEAPLDNGVLHNGLVQLSIGDTFTHAELLAGDLIFTHLDNETTTAVLTLSVFDDQGDSSAAVSLNFSVAQINDVPVLTTPLVPLAITEGGEHILGVSDIVVADPDDNPSNFVYSIDTPINHGSVYIGETELGHGDTFNHGQLLAGQVRFIHLGGENGTAKLALYVSDASGGRSNTEVIDFSVTGVNDAPVLSGQGGPVNLAEGGSYTLSTLDLTVIDPDIAAPGYTYQIVGNPVNGVLRIGELSLGNGDIFSHAALLSGALSYTHLGDETNTASIVIQVVDDRGAVSNSVNLLFTVNGVNDKPVLSVTPLSINEGATYRLSESDLYVTDTDGLPSAMIYQQVGVSAHGSLMLGDKMIGDGGEFSQSDLLSGYVTYKHGGDESSAASFNLLVKDNKGLKSDMVTVVLSVNPLNDAPTIIVPDTAIPENTAGYTVGQIQVRDDDENDTFVLSVDDDRFTISDGVLALKPSQSLDFEVEPTVTVTVTVTDSAGASDSSSVQLLVGDVNERPYISTPPEVSAGDGFQLSPSMVIDPDGDILSFTVVQSTGEALPDWISFNELTNTFQVLDEKAVSAELTVLIVANDGQGGEVSVEAVLTFEPSLSAAQPVTQTNIPEDIDLPEITTNQGSAQVEVASPTLSNSESTMEVSAAVSDTSGSEDAVPEDLIDERVDLQSLIAPLPSFDKLDLAVLQHVVGSGSSLGDKNSLDVSVDTLDLSQLLASSQQDTSRQNSAFANALDTQRDEIERQSDLMKTLVGSSAGISTGLSVGYLIWLIRGGTLMGSVLSSLPAWRFVDPLPVLATLGDVTHEDSESLESMVDSDISESDRRQL